MKSSRLPRNVVGAGAAGGTIGTVVAALADGMPETAAYKSVFTVAAPLLSMGIGGLWLFMKAVYIDPFSDRKKREAELSAMERILEELRTKVEGVLSSPNSTDEHRSEARRKFEDAEQLVLRKISERL